MLNLVKMKYLGRSRGFVLWDIYQIRKCRYFENDSTRYNNHMDCMHFVYMESWGIQIVPGEVSKNQRNKFMTRRYFAACFKLELAQVWGQ